MTTTATATASSTTMTMTTTKIATTNFFEIALPSLIHHVRCKCSILLPRYCQTFCMFTFVVHFWNRKRKNAIALLACILWDSSTTLFYNTINVCLILFHVFFWSFFFFFLFFFFYILLNAFDGISGNIIIYLVECTHIHFTIYRKLYVCYTIPIDASTEVSVLI